MRIDIRRGKETIALEANERQLVGHFRGPSGNAIANVSTTLRDQLSQPLAAPPLVRAIVPGDQIALALDSELPQAVEVVAPILENLCEGGVEPNGIHIICAPIGGTAMAEALKRDLGPEFAETIISVHDPENQKGNAYLASSKEGRRVYLNRELVEAGAVVPVGRTGFDVILGTCGTAGHLFPALSDVDARLRARIIAMESSQVPSALRERQICDEVGWMLGLYYSVGVAVDRDNRIEQIWTGEYHAVQRAADEWAATHWTVVPPAGGAELVVATISRRDRSDRWEDVAAALETAARLTGEQGRILVVTDLHEPLGSTGHWLVDSDNPWNVIARLREPHAGDDQDSIATAQIARTLTTAKVYLYSNLEADFVESLSMVSVGSAKEAANLVARSKSCFIVEDADRSRAS